MGPGVEGVMGGGFFVQGSVQVGAGVGVCSINADDDNDHHPKTSPLQAALLTTSLGLKRRFVLFGKYLI